MNSADYQIITIILSSLAIVFIPLLILLARIISKWTKVETKLDALTEDMAGIIDAKEKVHAQMFNQMAEDRKATDTRLRWLEENVWNRATRPR